MVPLQYKIIGIAIAILLAFGCGAYLGYQYCDGHVAKAYAEAQDAAITRFSEQADADKQDAIDRAQREAVAEERARTAKSKGVSDASIKAKPSCSRDAESYGLLVDAIAAANGTKESTGGLPKAVPDSSDSKGWFR